MMDLDNVAHGADVEHWGMRRCGATKKNGQPCASWPAHGETRCRWHPTEEMQRRAAEAPARWERDRTYLPDWLTRSELRELCGPPVAPYGEDWACPMVAYWYVRGWQRALAVLAGDVTSP